MRYLLGLCFCEHCLAAARAAGVDGDAVRREAREAIERAFAGDDPGGEPERDEYARVREQVVTSLVAEVAEAAGETPFEFIELSGAVKGYADGRPTGDPSPTIAWQLGVDVQAVAAACDGLQAMGYAADPAWVARDLETYGEDAVSVIFRPSTPDCDSAEDLRAKVDLARERGLRRVDFYHYGLMRLDALDWIREPLRPHVGHVSSSGESTLAHRELTPETSLGVTLDTARIQRAHAATRRPARRRGARLIGVTLGREVAAPDAGVDRLRLAVAQDLTARRRDPAFAPRLACVDHDRGREAPLDVLHLPASCRRREAEAVVLDRTRSGQWMPPSGRGSRAA